MISVISMTNFAAKQPLKCATTNIIQKRNFLKKIFGLWKKNEKCTTFINADTRIVTKGMSMPIIGIGTWQVEPDCVDSVLSYALDVGYRHIDTSHSYGNQAAIGATLDKLFKCGKFCRNDIFISSKLPYYAMNPENVSTYVTDSLNCLGLSYLDLFMVHFPVGIIEESGEYVTDPETNHIKIWKALEQEVEKNTIKALGLSNFNMKQIQTIMECATVPPANIQVEMHLFHQQKELRQFCSLHCMGLTAYAPLGSPGLDQYLMRNCLQAAKVPQPMNDVCVRKIACNYKKTPAQILLRFHLQNGVAVIPKSSAPERLYKNFDVFDFELNTCEMEELCGKDMGEKGRMFGGNVWIGTDQHPEYPFPPRLM